MHFSLGTCTVRTLSLVSATLPHLPASLVSYPCTFSRGEMLSYKLCSSFPVTLPPFSLVDGIGGGVDGLGRRKSKYRAAIGRGINRNLHNCGMVGLRIRRRIEVTYLIRRAMNLWIYLPTSYLKFHTLRTLSGEASAAHMFTYFSTFLQPSFSVK